MSWEINNLRDKKLLLLFTDGMSVEAWDRLGVLSREIGIYSLFNRYLGELWWLSYGSNDQHYREHLARNGIKLFLAKKSTDGQNSRKFDGISEFVEHNLDFLRQFDFIKTNQLSAANLGFEIKIRTGARLILRQGYITPLRFQLRAKNPLRQLIYFLRSRSFYHAADAIIITSNQAKNYIRKWFKIDSKKIHVIQNYIDTELFRTMKSTGKKRDILFIGRFAYQKNLFNLIRALDSLRVSMTMIGAGKYRGQIERLTQAKGLDILFHERVTNNELPSVYNAHRIFVLPSRYEGNSKVLLEAMACGMPVVASDVWGNDEIIKHMKNGYLCGTDVSSIRVAVRTLLSDAELRKALGANARESVLKNNDLVSNIEREIEIYIRLLQN